MRSENIKFLSTLNEPQLDPALLERIIQKLASLDSDTTLVTDFGIAFVSTMVAVREDAYQSWCNITKNRHGALITVENGQQYRLINRGVLHNSLDSFSVEPLKDPRLIILPTPLAEKSLNENFSDEPLSIEMACRDILLPEAYKSDIEKHVEAILNSQSRGQDMKFIDPSGHKEATYVEGSIFGPILETLVPDRKDEVWSRSHLFWVRWKLYGFFVVKRSSPLLETIRPHPKPEKEDPSVLAKPSFELSVMRSFSAPFLGKSKALSAFLDYLSRHYKVSCWKIDKKFENWVDYFSPLVCIHQSSGAGKSRLAKEVAPFLLPVVLSGPNATGLPKESEQLKEFEKFILGLKTPHMSLLLSLAHDFILRILLIGLIETLGKLKCTINADGDVSGLTLENVSTLFVEPLQAKYEGVNIIDGYAELALQHGSNRVCEIGKFVQIPAPKLGNIDEKLLAKLLSQIRAVRVKYLAKTLKRTGAAVEVEWLPHGLLIFDEAQHMLGLTVENKEKQVKDPAKIITCRDYSKDDLKMDIDSSTDVFRVIRRALGTSESSWCYFWGTTISTNTAITNFTPKIMDDPSLRGRTNVKLIPPFVYNESFDAFAEGYRIISSETSGTQSPPNSEQFVSEVGSLPSKDSDTLLTQTVTELTLSHVHNSRLLVGNNDGFKYAFSWQRIHDILSCGRPLYYSFVKSYFDDQHDWEEQINLHVYEWNYQTTMAFKLLYQMIESKVAGGREGADLLQEDLSEIDLVYVLLSVSVGLYGCPSMISKTDLVRRRMGWIVEVNTEESDLKVDFPSEGVYNTYLGQILIAKLESFFSKNKSEAFKTLLFFAKPPSQKAFSTWQITEILCRLIFLYAICRTEPAPFAHQLKQPIEAVSTMEAEKTEIDMLNERNHNLYGPRTLESFLKKLVAHQVSENFLDLLGGRFKDSVVAFGYFQECDEAQDPIASCKAMLYRGSGRYLPKQHPGADFMFPLVLHQNQGGDYGLVLVQVKGLAVDLLDPAQDREVSKAMQKCTIYGVFGMDAEDNRLSVKTKKLRLKKQAQHRSFPVVRILVNLSDCGGSPKNGARILSDQVSSFLVIQSDGTNIDFLQSEPHLGNFIQASLSLAAESSEGKMVQYEAQRKDPPFAKDEESGPFNPVYIGTVHDDDDNILFGQNAKRCPTEQFPISKTRTKNFFANRPDYKNIP